MSRLTEKVVNDKNVYVQRSIKQYGNLSTGEPLYTSIYTNKLGKIEDLEEQLGVPLEVVFKAIKSLGQDIIYEWQDGINKMYHKDTPSDEFCLVYCCLNGTAPFEYCFLFKDNIGIEICLPLKDYGKTWWLKGEQEHEED